MEHCQLYQGRNEEIWSLFFPNLKQWNVSYVKNNFLQVDVEAILAITIHQCTIPDKVVWSQSTNGTYSVKDGYRF